MSLSEYIIDVDEHHDYTLLDDPNDPDETDQIVPVTPGMANSFNSENLMTKRQARFLNSQTIKRYGLQKEEGVYIRNECAVTGYSRLENQTAASKLEGTDDFHPASEIESSASSRFVVYDEGKEMDFLKHRIKECKESITEIIDLEKFTKEKWMPKYLKSVELGTPISFTARRFQKQYYSELRAAYDLDVNVKKCLKRFWGHLYKGDKINGRAELDKLNEIYTDWIDWWTENVWEIDIEKSSKDGYGASKELNEYAQKRYYDHAMYSYNSFNRILDLSGRR